jgi:outer membrane receptor protein involved in Fe transport
LRTSLFANGLGLRLDGNWEGPSRVRSGRLGEGAGDLFFSDQLIWNIRAFSTFSAAQGIGKTLPWLAGTRVTLAIDNAFNERPRVRDSLGMTPQAFQSAQIDPIGRTVQISVRRLF